ncbi:family 43 glycosylhydrolase [Fulvivirga ligni]|uniref:family 43 glycosylhydrolase n=1 Tax=Fulvivirga ligni TaxID=2904246 RepID=UPI001F41BA1A|nr:family 43 glycosylhydrolase [Fulvivirga ligni]UII18956.1 family 43 glycosylhydrolase [Fulvivirga ligni]
MKLIVITFLLSLPGCKTQQDVNAPDLKTYCNPVNLSYRFSLEAPSRREAADPAIVLFKDTYYLFASKSGGYWYSDDLLDWQLVITDEIPVEDYAPTAIGIGDTLYFLASSGSKSTVYKSVDPKQGKWSVAVDELDATVWDPALFMDDDDRLYLYWGCSNQQPLYGVEVDYKNDFSFIGKPKNLKYPDPTHNGWEVFGEYNEDRATKPWIEAPWMNKHNGKYYLQYSSPGTQFKSYSDAAYVSDSPLGPFEVQVHNPMVYRPEGYIGGAGHGNTFADKYGNHWHIGTGTISQKDIFERRLVLFPSYYDEDGVLHSITKYGDYPYIMPEAKTSGFEEVFAGWMLLSYNKKVQVSSQLAGFSATNMTDENIRTYWVAGSGSEEEFAVLDLEKVADVYAVQINFAEHNSSVLGRDNSVSHKYTLEWSDDGTNWNMLADKSENTTDNMHDYIQLSQKIACRYLRLQNIKVPSGNLAISGFRVFGKGNGAPPAQVPLLGASRDDEDRRVVKLSWTPAEGAIGYNISYGIAEDKLYLNYMVYDVNELTINSLNVDQAYTFSIESFNENGITTSDILTSIQ